MQYQILMGMSRMICCLPHSFLLFLGKVLGHLYYHLIHKQRNLAIKQMKTSLNIPEDEAKRIVMDSFVNLGRNALEIMYMPHLSRKNFQQYILLLKGLQAL